MRRCARDDLWNQPVTARQSNELPREDTLDSSLFLLREGYRFTRARFQRLGTDVFQTRLMLRRATCVFGEDAASMFYAPERFTRRGALAPNSLMLLQDFGSVAVLDGNNHHWRKRMLMSLMTPTRVQTMVASSARCEMARSL